MGHPAQHFVGIDVGSERKGFHAVVLHNRRFEKLHSRNHDDVVAWCLEKEAHTIAVDAPCNWSNSGPSRQAERELMVAGSRINCFSTPTLDRARGNSFYDWIVNGQALFKSLRTKFSLFDGTLRSGPICFETFPHAVFCALRKKCETAKPKGPKRRGVLKDFGYKIEPLSNIDFVDAALCAVAAKSFAQENFVKFGNSAEGFIVVPDKNFLP